MRTRTSGARHSRPMSEVKKDFILRYGMVCAQCGKQSEIVQLDHILPLWDGGTNDDDNLQLLCVPCHKLKTAKEAKRRADVYPQVILITDAKGNILERRPTRGRTL